MSDTTIATNPQAGTETTATANTQPPQGGNDDNKFRRLHEAEEAKRKAAEARIAELEAAEAERTKAEMTEAERAKAEAAEAKAEAQKAKERLSELEREKLVNSIASEHGLTAEARELLSGADEAALRANAQKLASIMKQPAQAGTNTQPARGAEPSIDEKINAALKSGNTIESIRLARERAGLKND